MEVAAATEAGIEATEAAATEAAIEATEVTVAIAGAESARRGAKARHHESVPPDTTATASRGKRVELL